MICIGIALMAADLYANEPYHEKIEQLHVQSKQFHETQKKSQQLQKRLSEMGKEIRKLKDSKNDDFFKSNALQKKMQEAQQTSKELQGLYKKQSLLQGAILRQKNQLLEEIELKLTQAHLQSETENARIMKAYIALQEILPTQTSSTQPSQPFEFSLSTEKTYDRDEIKDQIVVLEDLQFHLKGLIDHIEQEATVQRQKSALSKELAFLINEEQFFGEQGFIQGRARKRELEANADMEGENTEMPSEIPEPPTEPVDPEPPIDPEPPVTPEIDPDTDLGLELEPEVDAIDQNFEIIDPKLQTQMIEDMFIYAPNAAMKDDKGDIITKPTDLLVANPQQISKNIQNMQRLQNETQTDFIARKLAYLQTILQNLQNQTLFLRKKLENL
jgi:hypothetical protein